MLFIYIYKVVMVKKKQQFVMLEYPQFSIDESEQII